MKFIHTADWQLGYKQYGFRKREQDFYKVGARIMRRAIDMKVDAVILAGDTFDMPKPPSQAVLALKHAVDNAASAGIPTYGVDGNHDPASGNWNNVCSIRDLVVGGKYSIEGFTISGIPFQRPSLFNKTVDELVDQGFETDILVIHQSVSEMCDFDAQEITAMELAPKLAQMGVKYVAMGNIHNYRHMELGGVMFCYSGSSEVNALDEDHNKCMVVVEMSRDEAGEVVVKPQIEPLVTRKIIPIILETDKDIDGLVEKTADDPLVQLWYDPTKREMLKRAELILISKDVMYKACPLSVGKEENMAAKLTRTQFERGGAMEQLKQTIEAYFDVGTAQFELVGQMLDNPEQVEEIMQKFMQENGVV